MSVLNNKIDFTVIFTVKKANPNGDPVDGNRPRTDYDGLGEMSDVCIKRKIRNRLQDMGEKIFVQSQERANDGATSLKDRADKCSALKEAKKDTDKFAKAACNEWTDVRSFGQVFAFKGIDVSVGVRGPVSIQSAESIAPVDVTGMQITKSVNSIDSEKKSSDTMGMKYRVDYGVYRFNGSMNVQLAEKTEFTEEDAEKIHEALKTLFENDCSSARPEGSMEIRKVYWWKHNSKQGQYNSAKVHRSVTVSLKDGCDGKSYEDYEIEFNQESIPGLEPEIYEV